MSANVIGPPPPVIVLESGPPGPPGPAGAPGPSGPIGPQPYPPTIYTQGSAASVWEFTHSYPYRPDVQTYDTSGGEMFGDVSHPNATTVRVTFGFAMTGSLDLR